MGHFTVNTHHAYLNNEIIIRSATPQSIIDRVTGKVFNVDKELKTYLTAGEHVLASGNCVEVIVIEDAIKLGGGRFKNAFVFDDSPWVFIVMKDRTYITNIETKEERIEYNITPDKINSLGLYKEEANRYFLLETCLDISIYDVISGRVVVSFSDLIYDSPYYVVYRKEEQIEIYDYHNDLVIDVFQGQYSVGNKFYYIKGNRLFGLGLNPTEIKEIHAVGELPDNVILDKNSLLVPKGDYKKQSNTIYKYYSFFELGNGEDDITCTSLLPFSFIDSWFGHKTGDFEKLKKDREEWLNIIKDTEPNFEKYLQVVCKGISFSKYNIIPKDGKKELALYGEYDIFPDLYGIKPKIVLKTILGEPANYKNISICEDCGKDEDYNKDKEKTDEANPIIPDGEKIIAYSPKKTRIITENCDGYFFYDISNSRRYPIFEQLFDRSKFRNAFFTSDGKSVILQISSTECQMLGIDDLLTTKFPVDGFTIAKNEGFNGYKPEISFKDNRIPVWRDPITLEQVSEDDMSSRIFMSPDGRYSADINMHTSLYNNLTDTEIDHNEYNELKQKYDWNRDSDEQEKKSIIELRKGLYEAYGKEVLFCKVIEYARNYRIGNMSSSEVVDNLIKHYLYSEPYFTNLFVDRLGFVCYRENTEGAETKKVLIGRSVYFLNYVSFSYDSRYMCFAAKMKRDEFRTSEEGVMEIYDLEKEEVINRVENYQNCQLWAVWMSVFSKRGDVAFYDSCANTYLVRKSGNYKEAEKASGKSLLCFSPSGRYIACSDQNYIDYTHHPDTKWGHQPSGNVFIYSVEKIGECLEHYNDMGDGISGVASRAGSVSSAAFSQDESRLLMVGNDGVVVIRNLKCTSRDNKVVEKINAFDDMIVEWHGR